MIRQYEREEPFLAATASDEWQTLEELVEDLDREDYWSGLGFEDLEPVGPMGKRRHVREMISHLWEAYSDEEGEKAFRFLASRLSATDDGGLERTYNLAGRCKIGEIEDLAEGHEAHADYHNVRTNELKQMRRATKRGEPCESLPEHFLAELTEQTLQKVWPGLEEEGRLWAITAGLKLHFATTELLEECGREHQAGRIVTSEGVSEYISRGMERAWEKIAGEVCEGTGISLEEARRFVGQPSLRSCAADFRNAYESAHDDSYGWTLDEHLRFTLEEA
jgi:hypothetical protein